MSDIPVIPVDSKEWYQLCNEWGLGNPVCGRLYVPKVDVLKRGCQATKDKLAPIQAPMVVLVIDQDTVDGCNL